MKKYAYAGPDPVPDGEGGMVRPGEVREYEVLPPWGPWTPVPDESGTAPGPVAAAPSPRRSALPASSTAPPAPAETPAPGEGEKL